MERRALQKGIIALRARQHEGRKALAKRIHHMRSSERGQAKEHERKQVRERGGLSREFEHAAANHEQDRETKHSQERTRKRTQGTDSPSGSRHRRLE